MGLRCNLANLFPDHLKLYRRRPPVEPDLCRAGGDLLHQCRHPNHKEFVQVRPQDGKEFNSLQKRVARVGSLFQNPALEFQQTQLAINVKVGIIQTVTGVEGSLQLRDGSSFRGFRRDAWECVLEAMNTSL